MRKKVQEHQWLRSRRAYLKTKKEVRPTAAAVLFLLSLLPFVISLAHSWWQNRDLEVSLRTATPFENLVVVRAVGFDKGYCEEREPLVPGQPAPRPTNFLGSANKAWLALLVPGVVFCFVGLAVVTDDYFVPSLERICERLNLSADVAGATFMAAGSSAPELFTSLLSVFLTKDDVGIGTIVGSAVFNVLVIIGLSAALAGSTLDLDFRPLMRDSFFYIVSIVLLIVFVLFSTPGQANWWEGLVLMAAYVAYILFMKFGNKPYFDYFSRWVKDDSQVTSGDVEHGLESPNTTHVSDPSGDYSRANGGGSPIEQPRLGYSNLNPRSQLRTAVYSVVAVNAFNGMRGGECEEERSPPKTILGILRPKTKIGWATFPLFFPWHLLYKYTIVDCSKETNSKWWPLTFLISILWISGISFIMVEGARLAGCYIGIPSAVMGLTFLAAGTSVPDALASVAVARNGQGNMAVCNAIGSNVFDILLGLGLPWFLAELILKAPQEVTIKPLTTVVVPIAILFAIIILLVALLMLLRWKLSKMLGYVLFGAYGVFIAYSLLENFVFNL